MTQPPYPGPPDDAGDGRPAGEPAGDGSSYPPPPTQQPYGAQPYGQQPYSGRPPYGGQQPYGGQPPYGGQQPYGGQYPAWQGGNDAQRSTNGTSIAAFILNLTPCGLVLPGWICAVIGLRQIKRTGSKGRWAAITALVLGAVWAVAIGGLVVGGVWLFSNIVTPDNAEAGTCVNIENDADEVSLLKQDCDGGHDGEIVFVGTYGEAEQAVDPSQLDLAAGEEEFAEGVCRQLVGADPAGSLGDEYTWSLASEDPQDPADSDRFICYVQLGSGDQLDEPVG